MFDIIAVGSATLDVFACTEQCGVVSKRLQSKFLSFPLGSKILIEHLDISTGGGGTNTAVCLSRLGLKTGFIGKVGKGRNSDRLLEELKKEKIVPLVSRDKNSRTGYSVILDSCTHDRVVLSYRGSNDDLKFSEINKKRAKAKWFLLCGMKGRSATTLSKIAAHAKKSKSKVGLILNPFLARMGIRSLEKLLSNTDVVIMNKEESYLLSKKKNIQKSIEAIARTGPRIVVVTDAKNPIVAYDAESRQYYVAKPSSAAPVETTGAGDAFGSSFVAGLLLKNSIEFGLQMGMANAESVILHHGAKNKLLTYRQILQKVKKSPFKVKQETV